MTNPYENSSIIINTDKNTHELIFFEENFQKEISRFQGDNKLIILGAIGKMRVGKSSALNNFLTLLTNKDIYRPFSEIECVQSNTRGIHIIAIPWEDIALNYQDKLKESFNEKVDIILLDCEGTESSDNVATSRLYLMNMLINSVIHIHVSKAIDLNFATKLSQALISSNEILQKLGGDLKEMLPCLYILIKDTTKLSWENAKKADPTLLEFQDLLRDYEHLKDYYQQFPKRDIMIVPPPKTDEEGSYVVDDKNSLYWKTLQNSLDLSIKNKNLKTKSELIIFIKNLANIINTNNLLNVKTELDNFYNSMFNKQKSEMLKKIINKGISKFNTFTNFSVSQIHNYFLNIFNEEIKDFNEKISNISCKWLFNKLEAEILLELEKILSHLEELYLRKKQEYLLNREITKENENVYEDQKEEIKKYSVERNHDNFKGMYPCCGSDISAEGCFRYVTSSVSGGNAFVSAISFGLAGQPKVKVQEKSCHPRTYGTFCSSCFKPQGSLECRNEVKENIEEFSKKVLVGINQKYTIDDWKDKDFQNDAAKYFIDMIDGF